MKTQEITTYEDIDWELLWRNARSRKSWRSKGAREWDKKARSFRERTAASDYVPAFLEQLQLDPNMSVLDVGCGPGTLALPIAERVARVTALDYSEQMLDELEKTARTRGLDNIRCVLCAWEDDWTTHGIALHDIAIASRSMNIDDLGGAAQKLDAHAARQVFIADRIDPSPFDPDAFAAVGRPFDAGPDYIYTLNTLYGLGIHPKIGHIELASEVRYADLDEAVASYTWMFRDLTEDEAARLRSFVRHRIIAQENDAVIIKRRHPQRWALLSWNKEP